MNAPERRRIPAIPKVAAPCPAIIPVRQRATRPQPIKAIFNTSPPMCLVRTDLYNMSQ
jgi:hypothetical protein